MKKISTVVFVSILCVLSAQAQRYWVSTTAGNWNDPANWGTVAAGPGGAGVPTAGTNVFFTSSFSGNCILDVAPSVGNFTISTYTGTIDLNGNTLSTTGAGTFTSGTISNTGGAASLALSGTTNTFNGTLFNADVTGSSVNLNFNGSTFNGSVNVTKSGTVNDNGLGGNTFNGPVTLTTTGAGGQIQLANTNPDIFNGLLTLNIGTAAIVVGRVAAGNQYNNNIIINYNATSTAAFGSQGGSGTLAVGRTITIGSVDASGCGNLTLARFTTPTAQNISLGGNTTAILTLGPASSFGGNLTATAPGIILNSSTFQGVTQLTKTGSTDDGQRGGNIFNGTFTLNNNGSADFRFGSNAADAGDAWNADATFNNASGNRIRVGELTTGNVFMANATFNDLGSGTDVADRIQISRLTGAETTFNGTTTFNNLGVTSDIQISFDPGTLTTFNGPLFFNENTTGAADDQIGNSGDVVINNNVTISNASTNIVYMSAGSGTVTLANGTINIGGSGFGSGQLRLNNLTQTGNTDQFLTLTGTAALRVGPNTSFNGNVDFRAPQLLLDGATYGGTVNNFEKTGATSNTSAGGNIFNNTPTGTTTMTNSGSGSLSLGNTNADQFNGITTFNNTGSSRLYFANNHPAQTTTFTGALTINSAKSSGSDTWSILMAESGTSAVAFGGAVTLNCSGTIRSDIRFLNGTGSTATYAGILTIANTNSHPSTAMNIGNNGASTYNNDIVMSNSNGPTQMLFNVTATASSTLADTRTISITGFADGTLSLPRFTQIGTTPQTLNTFSGTATLTVGPNSAFGGNVDFKAPQVYLNGCNYGGTATIEKTGATDNAGTGGNIFGGVTIITNSGSGYFMTGAGNSDTFNGVTTFNNVGSYRIYFAHNHPGQTTTFAADVILNSNKTGSGDNWSFFYGDSGPNQILFGGKLTVNCAGTIRSDHRFLNGTGSSATYTGTVTINNTNSHPSTAINIGLNGTSTYNGDIVVSNINGPTLMTFNGNATASSILTNNGSISIGASGFAGGTLTLPRFTQIGNTAQILKTFSSAALLVVGPNSSFDGEVEFRAPQIQLQGCTYARAAIIEKNGATDNNSNGGNIFNGTTTITNSSSGVLLLGNTNADQFNGITTFNNTGTNRFVFANSHTNQTTSFGSDLTINCNRTGAVDQWAYVIAENPNIGVTFGGNVTLNWQGALRSDLRILNGAGTTATYAGNLTINNTNASTATTITLGATGTSTYNGDISVSNGGGAAGISFNTNITANATLTTNRTISINGNGFVNGTLNLPRFTQISNTPQTLNTFSGTALLIVGPASSFEGAVDFRAPQVQLQGATYARAATIEKNGATDNNSTGGNAFNDIATISNSGSGFLSLGNTNADQFTGIATFNNTGSSHIAIANNHAGQTTTFFSNVILNSNKTGSGDQYSFQTCESANSKVDFGGSVTINCLGSFRSDHRFLQGVGTTAAYAGALAINLSNSNSSTALTMGANGVSTYNGNISVTNSGGASGIFFNTAAVANAALAANRTISLGSDGFSSGTLSLIRFTQIGNTLQTLNTFSGTALLIVGPASAFGGDVNFRAPQVLLNGCTYGRSAYIEKNGAGDNTGNGGDIFQGITTIVNSGSGSFELANTLPETFNGDLTVNNTGTYRIQIGIGSANNVFNGTTIFNHAGTASASLNFIIARNASSSAIFNGPLFLNNSNGNSNSGILIGNDGNVTLNNNVTVSSTGSGRGIFMSGSGGSVTLNSGFRVKDAGPGTFTTGTLSFNHFTQVGTTTPQAITLTGNALISMTLSQFNSTLNFKAPQLTTTTTTYNAAVTFEKTGATDNASSGSNVFNSAAALTNSGSGYLLMGNGAPDQFVGATTFNNNGTYRIYFAHAHTGQATTFGSNLTLNSNKSGGADAWSYLVAEGTGSRYTVAGNFTINIAGTVRSDHRFLTGTSTSATYAGNVVINSTSSHSSTDITMGVNGTSTYNGNITVSNTNGGATSGTFFNTGVTASSTMAATKVISIGAGGFINGTLSLIRFTQTGGTPQTITMTGSATLIAGPTVVFDGNVDFRAPQVLLHGGIYNGTAAIEKNGASNNDSNGGNTFNGATTITSSGAGRFRLALTTADTYNGAVTFVKTGAGAFEPAYAQTNTFAGDITTNGATAFIFGSGGGVVEFIGSSAQAVNRVGSSVLPVFQRIRLNKTAGVVTLNTVVNVGLTTTFTSGVMNTTATNYLNFNDDATATGTNDLSYVTGPVRKTGNDAFTFPVGGDNYYRPISISAPSNAAHHFTAQYLHAAQGFGGKTTWDPAFWTVGACDYWILDRTGATPAPVSTVTVTLSWNDAICGGAGYITSLPDLRVTRWDATTSKWVNHGNGATTGTISNGTISSAGAVTSFSPFALASVTRLNPLPVELTAFRATDLGASVSLDWTTASELNSKSFTVQRSQSGLDFDDLTEIEGAGTKVTESKYNFVDESPYPGLSYYRLKQTDYNGDVSYPGITAIHRDGKSAAFNVYPNPAGNEVVHFTQKANITIINSLDQEIGSAQGVTSIDVSGLKAGVYMIRNQNGQVAKLVKK